MSGQRGMTGLARPLGRPARTAKSLRPRARRGARPTPGRIDDAGREGERGALGGRRSGWGGCAGGRGEGAAPPGRGACPARARPFDADEHNGPSPPGAWPARPRPFDAREEVPGAYEGGHTRAPHRQARVQPGRRHRALASRDSPEHGCQRARTCLGATPPPPRPPHYVAARQTGATSAGPPRPRGKTPARNAPPISPAGGTTPGTGPPGSPRPPFPPGGPTRSTCAG